MLLIWICYLLWNVSCLSPKRRVWVTRESLLSNIRLSVSLILLMRVNLWLEKWVQWRKKCAVDLSEFPQLHKGFLASSKLCQNLCFLRWLKPTRNLVKSFIPLALCTFNMLFASGVTNLNRCFLNKTQLSALRISWSNLFHSMIIDRV